MRLILLSISVLLFVVGCNNNKIEDFYGIGIGGKVLLISNLSEYSNLSRYTYKGLNYRRYHNLFTPEESEATISSNFEKYKILSKVVELEALDGITSAVLITQYMSNHEREKVINEITDKLGKPEVSENSYFFQRGFLNINQALYEVDITYLPELYFTMDNEKYYRTTLSAKTKQYVILSNKDAFIKGANVWAEDFF